MSCEIEQKDDCVYVAGAMTIYQAHAIAQALLGAVRDRKGPAQIDVSHVSEIDTAGIQVLLMARRESLARGEPVSICSPSAAVREAMSLCGLEELLAASDAQEARS